MTYDELKNAISDELYIRTNQFQVLSEIAQMLNEDENNGRDLLIRILEHRDLFSQYEIILTELIQKSGLLPYIEENQLNSISAQLAYEFHRPFGMDDIVLHSMQMSVYQKLLAGENVILSAPTSFGKSLLIDAMIASGKYNNIVIIVPTIALIDETRARLSANFSSSYKIITHATQKVENKTIYVLTQERFLEFTETFVPDFFVIDEFYKLNSGDYDTRTVSLNTAFARLYRSSAQFLLIGPNIQSVNVGSSNINFSFVCTDFKTVATDIVFVNTSNDLQKDCIAIAQKLKEQTLIFCKSSNSAYDLAKKMIAENISFRNQKAEVFAAWLRKNFHQDWFLADCIEHGIAIHYGALPRSISHYLLKLFNDGVIRFLLCTSTIIEGVNTAAKNIIIYDNKIATKKFDLFTFNNIKGRAGRMFKYFVGKVYLLNNPPEDELPLVDIPVLSVPSDLPVELSFDVPERSLSDYTKEQLRLLHAQDYLDVSVTKQNISIPAMNMVNAAKEITDNISKYAPLLCWTINPDASQLQTVCRLIFDILLDKKGSDGIYSAEQLNFKMRQLQYEIQNGVDVLIAKEFSNKKYCKNADEAIESVLTFLRQWGEFNFPRLLKAINDIQKFVLSKYGRKTGEYTAYIEKVRQLFLPLSATLLEEYGIPFQITLKIEEKVHLGDNPDDIISNLKNLSVSDLALEPVEASILKGAILQL